MLSFVEMAILLKNISQIVNITRNSKQTFMVDGYDLFCVTSDPDFKEKYAILLDSDGNILSYGSEDVVICPNYEYNTVIDCKGGAVLPGFTDAHTYPVWGGDREDDFFQKVAGASYMELSDSVNSFHSDYTVERTANASEDSLYAATLERIKSMASKGTTTIECKTDYSSNWATEKKILRVLTKLKRTIPLDISITYFAASILPKNLTSDSIVEDVVNTRLPDLQRSIENGEIIVDSVDVKCAEGFFTVEQSRQILCKAQAMGLRLNFHAESISNGSSAGLAASLMARAVSHLDEMSPAGVAALTSSRTAAVLLPTTTLLLHHRPPPAIAIAQAGVPIALGTDFRANLFCTSMPIVMYLACTTLGMTLEQAITAATINAAYSIGLSHRVGAITEGRQGDFVVINTRRWENIIFRLGESQDLIEYVIKKGRIIYAKATGRVIF
ncbi:putative imidazolonepropionase [Echinococcus granulosus]|nr:putative imidazolonepropionase [Echinococcus granulosus]